MGKTYDEPKSTKVILSAQGAIKLGLGPLPGCSAPALPTPPAQLQSPGASVGGWQGCTIAWRPAVYCTPPKHPGIRASQSKGCSTQLSGVSAWAQGLETTSHEVRHRGTLLSACHLQPRITLEELKTAQMGSYLPLTTAPRDNGPKRRQCQHLSWQDRLKSTGQLDLRRMDNPMVCLKCYRRHRLNANQNEKNTDHQHINGLRSAFSAHYCLVGDAGLGLEGYFQVSES